jgi:hypothetical protein
MVDVTDKEALTDWLQQQPRELVVLFAARCAWRVWPLMEVRWATSIHGLQMGDLDTGRILPLLRGGASALVASTCPTSAEGREAAADATTIILAATSVVADNTAFRSAAAAATFRAAAAATAYHTTAANAAAATTVAAFSVAAAAAADFGATFTLRADTDAAFGAAAQSDVDAIARGGLTAESLSARPLWPDGEPQHMAERGKKFTRDLLALDEHWDVWIDWHAAMLRGGPRFQDRAFARAIDDLELWKGTPREVNARIKALVEEERAKYLRPDEHSPPLPIIEGLPSPVEFELSAGGLIKAAAGSMVLPEFRYPGNDAEHAEQIALVNKLAADLIAQLRAQKYQVRPDYLDFLVELQSYLPGHTDGNLKWADTAFRSLTSLFNAEASFLPPGFASRLKTLGEEYQGLRAFYDGLQTHYERIRKGKISRPLPSELRRQFQKIVAEATPYPFDPPVQSAVVQSDKAALPPAESNTSPAAVDPTVIRPIPDPIANVDPGKDRDQTFASVANALGKVVEKGDKIHKGVEGWSNLREKVRPVWEGIYQWWSSGGGDGPPMPPPIIMT